MIISLAWGWVYSIYGATPVIEYRSLQDPWGETFETLSAVVYGQLLLETSTGKGFLVNNNNYNCILCNGHAEETAFHQLFDCPYNRRCWIYFNIQWGHSLSFFQMIAQAKGDSTLSFFLMEIFLRAAWKIWKKRNGKFFQNSDHCSFLRWLEDND